MFFIEGPKMLLELGCSENSLNNHLIIRIYCFVLLQMAIEMYVLE